MPYADSSGVRLWFDEAGSGPPLLFLHELASDARQWRGQVDHFAARFRCIVPNARGYPPSDVPADDGAYLWERQVDDIGAVLDAAGLDRAVLIGWSMGAYAALQFAQLHPDRALAVVAVGVGSGSPAAGREDFQAQMRALADTWETEGPEAAAALMAEGPNRQPLRRNNPAAWDAWLADLVQHSPAGMARTCRNFQALRPSLEDFMGGFAAVTIPLLLMVGEHDEPCHETTAFLARTIPGARRLVLPGAGHAPNLEDPDGFNRAVDEFLGSIRSED